MMTAFFYFITAVLLITAGPLPAAPAASLVLEPDTILPDTLKVPVYEEDTVITGEKKSTLRFSLLLPLYLEDNFMEDTAGTEPEIDPRSLSALHFYEGALLAKEALAAEGITLELSVTDIAYHGNAKHVMLINYQELRKSDLVIANFLPAECESAADEAGRLGLRLALTQYGNEILAEGRPNLILMSSPPFVQCRLMAEYIAVREPLVDYYIISRTENRENELAEIFYEVLDSSVADTSLLVVTNFEEVFPKMLSLVDTLYRSTLVIPSSDESYVSSVLNRLDTLNIPLTITGLPTWENFETMRLGRFRNLSVRIFSSTWFDEKVTMVHFRKKFIDRYKTDALFSAYQAYDFCVRMARTLSVQWKSFPFTLPGAFSDSDLMRFVRSDGGYMNTRLEVLEYQGFELRKAE